MEVFSVPEHGHAGTYLIQGSEFNPDLAGQVAETMYNEASTEYVMEQSLYYPAATNYGYYCTGLESPAEWDDHQRSFGLDGQDIQYAGAQTENMPYVYYTPTSYGYVQSPYNPYNPYIPGAIIGVDGSYLGTQQYYTVPTYDNPASSSPYYPMVVQNGTPDHFIDNNSSAPANARVVLKPSSNPPRPAPSQTSSFKKVQEASRMNAGSSKQLAVNGNQPSGSFSSSASAQAIQGRGVQVMENVQQGKAWSNRNQLKVPAVVPANGMSNFGSSANSQGVVVDKVRPKLQDDKVLSDVNASAAETSTEQNRGLNTNKNKNQLAVKAYTNRAGVGDAQGNIIIYTDDYNKDDFPLEYSNAKFFVIKSYSEDDVHKSIKYNVWSSTPNGNKKLNTAYEDAQVIAAGNRKACPIFLFFSVNASGQFCGVAEMTGPVNFHKDMDFWQQDKWSGSFPVKWHFIKDLPNPNFRHVILENNENKPVTNSRDTQEIRFKKGVEMLKIFKNYTSKTSLFDDFMYYENRQKILQEEKAKLLVRKNYENPFLVSSFEPPRKLNYLLDLPSTEVQKIANQRENIVAEKKETISVDEKADGVGSLRIGSLRINPSTQVVSKQPLEATKGAATVTDSADVVTVGTVPVKVNGFSKPSGILTVGTIQLDPLAVRPDKSGGVSSKNATHKG
jgi:hypothetical protein